MSITDCKIEFAKRNNLTKRLGKKTRDVIYTYLLSSILRDFRNGLDTLIVKSAIHELPVHLSLTPHLSFSLLLSLYLPNSFVFLCSHLYALLRSYVLCGY